MTLQDLCERIVRDAIPTTDSGATCFVPRYQIDQLREAIAAARLREPAGVGGEVLRAARDVCAYDWSDNDEDAVEAIHRLRNAMEAAPQPPAEAQPVAWFPTYDSGEIVRHYGDGSTVYACKTREEAERVKRIHLGATGPVVPLYLAPAEAQALTGDPKILWGVVANAGRLSGNSKYRWSHVIDATGQGSQSSIALCHRFGFDPDERVGGHDDDETDDEAEAQAQGGGEVMGHLFVSPYTVDLCPIGAGRLPDSEIRRRYGNGTHELIVRTTPPSAPVGVGAGWYRYNKPAPRWEDTKFGKWLDPAVYGPPREQHGYSLEVAALAQQPAAVDGAMVERATTAYLQSRGTYEGEVPVDRDDIRAALTAALAAQPQGGA